MKVCFSGFDTPILLDAATGTTLEIENPVLFSRVCQSFVSCRDDQAIEPFSVWKETNDQVKSREVFLVIQSPFDLPWDHKLLSGKIGMRLESLALEDDGLRCELESLDQLLRSKVANLGFQMASDYSFSVEWELKKYLKAFGFGVDLDPDESLFDKLMKFFEFVADALFTGVLVFMNLKIFLSKSELEQLFDQAFRLNLSLFLLEGSFCDCIVQHERKIHFDQHFLEY